jgi:hypothetical protein
MRLVVHYKQQLFFADLLRSLGWKFNIIAFDPDFDHATYGVQGVLEIEQLIPKVLGYTEHFEHLEHFGHAMVRKYVLPPPDLSSLTEAATVTDGMAYRYCVMTDLSYCPLLLAKLLVMKNVVVLDVADPEVMEFYRTCTLPQATSLDGMSATELRQLAEELYQAYTLLPCNLPEQTSTDSFVRDIDEVPEDMLDQGHHALVTTDKGGAQHLVLSPTDGPDTLPEITILTRLPTAVTKAQQLLLHKCWLDNRYPVNKITWMVDAPSGRPEWWTWGGDRVHFVQDGTTSMTVIWDLDYYYYPHSTYAKIKLMLDNPHIKCVGSSLVGGIDICKPGSGYTFRQRRPGRPNRSTIAYRSDWKSYQSTYMDLPFNFNAIRIATTVDDADDANVKVIKLLDDSMRSFVGKLSRQIV